VIGTRGFLAFSTRFLRTVGNDTIIDCLAVGDGADGVRLTVV
jgi:hypothetical protein